MGRLEHADVAESSETSQEPGPRLVVVVGPTAVGKTEFSLRLASRVGGEILSADSRQVYRYLDVGTGKATKVEQARVRHHLLDVVCPDEPFDAAEFSDRGVGAIADARRRGRPIIVCGGSGLYVRALLYGLFPGPKAEPSIRTRLAGADRLHDRLAAIDPETAARVHPKDRVRIIRALEVKEVTGRSMSEWQHEHRFARPRYPALVLALKRERETLRSMIGNRCEAMMAGGLVEEVAELWRRGYGPELAPLQTLGYRHVGTYLSGACTRTEALELMKRDTCRYAKRQMTWFRGDESCRWYDAACESDRAIDAAERFLGGGARSG